MFSLSCSFESSFFMDFAEAMAANILPCLLSNCRKCPQTRLERMQPRNDKRLRLMNRLNATELGKRVSLLKPFIPCIPYVCVEGNCAPYDSVLYGNSLQLGPLTIRISPETWAFNVGSALSCHVAIKVNCSPSASAS